MSSEPKKIQNTYLGLVFGNTLAASFIWGINTIFLLDAGLSNFEAFAANAFFTAGMVLFEVPTGVVADTRGRRTSFLLGAFTLGISTLLYVLLWNLMAPFWAWAVVSILLGLGFTFFSGALEAWVVDALMHVKASSYVEPTFSKAQTVTGIAMLSGSVLGGFIAQTTNLGVPYVIRSLCLFITMLFAFMYMKDLGFTPARSAHPLQDVKKLLQSSLHHGLKNPPVRWIMLAEPFSAGVSIYIFYALQPYLLQLYGDEKAYGIAGLVAAIVAGSQITGGLLAPYLKKVYKRRTTILIVGACTSVLILAIIGLVANFWLIILLVTLWGLISAMVRPVRQAYLNSLISSKSRATVLSFDSLMGSSGGVVSQPALGRVADVYGYAPSYLVSAAIQSLAVPFLIKARAANTPSDTKSD
jgi:MFS family permease